MPALRDVVADRAVEKKAAIEAWYRDRSHGVSLPFYSSIDVRDAKFKVAPVDSNLYPAGFNNLCPDDVQTASYLAVRALNSACSECGAKSPKKIVVIPEQHTKNKFYTESLETLLSILTNAGFEARIGQLSPESPEALSIRDDLLKVGDFVPDLIILNNDFSAGYPPELDRVKQVILPSHRLGWHSRRKSTFFRYYNQLAGEYAELLGLDPWLLRVESTAVEPVDFTEGVGMERVRDAVADVLRNTAAKYDEHGVKRKPFAFVKNNSGTYGMGIMTVHDASEFDSLNRRTKNKMSVGKGGHTITSVIVQEGVPTDLVVNKLVAEPVIYMFGADPVGGFLRTHQERSDEENLNSPGMVFRKLCLTDFHAIIHPDNEFCEPGDRKVRNCTFELAYGSVARISALAAGMEIMTEKTKGGLYAPSQHP